MQILHIISSLSPSQGGPPEAVRQLVKAYQDGGVGIEVVCLDRPHEPFLADIGCTVHALGQSFLGRYSFSPALWRWLHVNAAGYDALIVNGIWTFPSVAARVAARRTGMPYGVFVHGALDPWFNKRYPQKQAKKWLYWRIQYAVLRDATAVFFTTATERDLAKTSFRPNDWNSVVVPYGIGDPEHSAHSLLNAAAQIEAFRKILPSLEGRRYLLFLGRIHEKKGCDLLLGAFSKLAASIPEVDIVIAGPDPTGLQGKLRELSKQRGIASRVHWPGELRGAAKWGALRSCEAFVLPSHQENFGIAVVEALAVGRPVLISNQVNIWPEIVSDGAGFADEDTADGTERLLRRWFDLTLEEQEARATRARPVYLQRYSLSKAVAVINRVLKDCKAGSVSAESMIQRERPKL